MTPKRDYVRELAAAFRAEDLDTTFSIAMELAIRDGQNDARLEAQAERKRRSRLGKSQAVTDSHATGVTGSQGFPGPLPNSPTTTAATAREADDEALVRKARTELIGKLGGGTDVIALVDRFEAAVPGGRVHPWLTGLITWLRPPTGGPSVPVEVMTTAMTDWLIADRNRWPWEGRKFRSFIEDVTRQRNRPPRANGNGTSRGTTVSQRTMQNGLDALGGIK